MLDLHQLSSPPGCGEVTACECEGVLRAHDPDTASRIAQNMLGCGEPVVQAESNETVRPALGKQDAQHAFTAKPRLPATLAAAYRERGVLGLLEQMSQQGSGDDSGRASYTVGCVAAALLLGARRFATLTQSVTGAPSQHVTLERAYSTRTQTSSAGSNIVCISWHGVSRRLAVGYMDDSVRILSQKNLQPILKHRTQRAITQVHWLPYSMSVVCVACDAGVLLWSVDPASVVTRPSGACVTLLPTPRSALPTVMDPHPQGTSVVCSSGEGVSVWDTALVTSARIQEGGSVTHLCYSPDATQLLVVIASPPTLRVFNTSDWSFMEWVCGSSVSCVTWSECSQYIVFSTSAPSTLYSISPNLATNTATTLADLTAVQLADADDDLVSVGGSVRGVAWGGERLVVLFHSCPYIVMFHTSTLHAIKLAIGGIIKGPDDCVPITADFHPSRVSLLSVVWSDNSLQHVPLVYTSRQTATAPTSYSNSLTPGPSYNTSLNVPPTYNTSLVAGPSYNTSLLGPGYNTPTNPASVAGSGYHGLIRTPSKAHNIIQTGYADINNTPIAVGNGAGRNISLLGDSIFSPVRDNSYHGSMLQGVQSP